MQTFDLLIKPIQEAIWDMGWPSFRPIQDESINIIVNSNDDLVISAPTASGKTEAAFLPLISENFDDLHSSVAILYISPLKALINDQFDRVMSLCKKTNIQVTKWHGDANNDKKKKLLKSPKGILLITPESIESLLMRKEVEARKLFHNLKAVVIDEVHSFINNERGVHLYSLLNRIAYSTENFEIRKISLSATIGDLNSVKTFMSENPENVKEVIDTDFDKEVFGDVIVIKEDEKVSLYKQKLYELTKSGKTLAFSNGKNLLESSCDSLKNYSQKKKVLDIYRIHHGSLSKEIREETERELKESNNLCVFCTNTLELGLDVGDVNKVILLNPPWSVSSFIQRIGRSGRKDDEAIKFAFIYKKNENNDSSLIYQKLFIPIIKSIAIVELYLEGFCESYLFNLNDYSCLVHQLFAYITQRGGCRAAELYEIIIQKSFKNILDVDSYVYLLEYLNRNKYIEQFDNGDILLSEKGERISEDFHFYAVFQTPENWRIVNNGEKIGEIPLILFYQEGDQILLAGKRWDIISIDEKHKEIIVQRGRKKKDVMFNGNTGNVTKEIHQKMKQIFEEKKVPTYVNEVGKEVLEEAFRNYDIIQEHKSAIFLFQGSKIANSIKAILKSQNIEWEDFEIGMFLNGVTKIELLNSLEQTNLSDEYYIDLIQDLNRVEKTQRKFDYLLPEDFLNKMYLNDNFDVLGLKEYLKTGN